MTVYRTEYVNIILPKINLFFLDCFLYKSSNLNIFYQLIYFHYYKRNDTNDVTLTKTSGKVSDPSNIPYKFLTYTEINSMGRNWIRKYTLALSKELLGIIRSKYASLPLPNGEVSMDGEALKSEGREEKANLLEELSTFLEAVSKKEQAATEQEVDNSQQEVLNKAPLKIYIG